MIDATLADQSYPSSTGMWVGCEVSAATTTYQLAGKFSRPTAMAGLQPHAPPGLTAHVTISGDGRLLREFTAREDETTPIDLPVNGIGALVVAAIRRDGTCEISPVPYGALGDAVLIP